MKKLVKLWLAAFILAMVFYYIPVYLFSSNLEGAVKSVKVKDAAALLLWSEMNLNSQYFEDSQDGIDAAASKLANSGRFNSNTTIWNALKSNPHIQSVELVQGKTPRDTPPYIDPLYHGFDIGLKFKLSDGSGAIIVFDMIDQSFLGGHGAKVFRIPHGYRLSADGKVFDINDPSRLAQLVLSIFGRDQNWLVNAYNDSFDMSMPAGKNAPDSANSSVTIPTAGPHVADVHAKAAQVIAGNPSASPLTRQAAASGSFMAGSASTTAPVSLSDCVQGWITANHEAAAKAGVDDAATEDQIDEWKAWYKAGKQAQAIEGQPG